MKRFKKERYDEWLLLHFSSCKPSYYLWLSQLESPSLLIAVGRTLQPGVVVEETSQNEARKALLNPAWTAGQKITT